MSGIIAIIILFQPEIRNVLSKVGRKNFLFLNYEEDVEKDEMKKTIHSIATSAKILSEKKKFFYSKDIYIYGHCSIYKYLCF